MRKCFMLVFGVLIVFLMAGCTSDINNVKLKSESEIHSYATKHFGKDKIVEAVKNDETKCVIYELQDSEFGFHYKMASYASEIVIDATKTGYFTEKATNDFKENYQNYIMEQLDIENIYQRTIDISRLGQPMLFSISCETEEAEYYLGSYAINSGEFINRYEEYVESLIASFAVETNKNSGNLDGITYLYYEQLQYKDVEGIKLEWLFRKNVTSEDWTTAYYFDYNGETYFMLDDRVNIDKEVGMVHCYYDKNYTNY